MLDKLLVSDTPDLSTEGDFDMRHGSSHAGRSEIHGEATTRSAILTAIGDRYYALSAACALFKCVAALKALRLDADATSGISSASTTAHSPRARCAFVMRRPKVSQSPS
jgi:hypothetical protein